MKKLILSLLIIPLLSIVGYSSASFMKEFHWEFNCFPWDIKNVQWNINEWWIDVWEYKIINSPINNFRIEINDSINRPYEYNWLNFSVNSVFYTNWRITFYFPCENLPTEDWKKVINFTVVSSDYQPPVVEWWSSNITPVIVWLFGVYWELIPYVVYIWIWILIVTVWFYAIRRLVNWLSDKIHNNFKF